MSLKADTLGRRARQGDLDKLKSQIADRGWTFGHVLDACEFCKKAVDKGAGDHHTGWWLGNVMEGYFRGRFALAMFNEGYPHAYDIVSSDAFAIPQTHVQLWSVAALREKDPRQRIVEHGTPRRDFARLIVFRHYVDGKLTEQALNALMDTYYKVAVITKEEDRRLNQLKLRSKMMSTPEARWAAAKIELQNKSSPQSE